MTTPIEPEVIDHLVRGDRVCLASDPGRQGVLDGWVHELAVAYTEKVEFDGITWTVPVETIRKSIAVNWDDGTASNHDRAELRLVRRFEGGE